MGAGGAGRHRRRARRAARADARPAGARPRSHGRARVGPRRGGQAVRVRREPVAPGLRRRHRGPGRRAARGARANDGRVAPHDATRVVHVPARRRMRRRGKHGAQAAPRSRARAQGTPVRRRDRGGADGCGTARGSVRLRSARRRRRGAGLLLGLPHCGPWRTGRQPRHLSRELHPAIGPQAATGAFARGPRLRHRERSAQAVRDPSAGAGRAHGVRRCRPGRRGSRHRRYHRGGDCPLDPHGRHRGGTPGALPAYRQLATRCLRRGGAPRSRGASSAPERVAGEARLRTARGEVARLPRSRSAGARGRRALVRRRQARVADQGATRGAARASAGGRDWAKRVSNRRWGDRRRP